MDCVTEIVPCWLSDWAWVNVALAVRVLVMNCDKENDTDTERDCEGVVNDDGVNVTVRVIV